MTPGGLVEIDGSHGEGGGQLLRTAVALSAITHRPLRIKNIRGGRPNPGMQAQHLKAVEAVASLCDARLDGARLNSKELVFEPRELSPRSLKIDIGTAGAVTLVLQALVLAAARMEGTTRIELIGGTHVAWSPPVDHFRDVFCVQLKRLGIDVNIKLHKHGFFPKGGGRIEAEIEGTKEWQFLDLPSPGQIHSVIVQSIASLELSSARVAERQVDGFRSVIGRGFEEKTNYVSSLSTGSALSARAVCDSAVLGGDSLGKRGVRAEQVGQDAARKLKAEIDSGVSLDVHAADMLLPYLALSPGTSTFTVREMSPHFTSVQWLLKHFIDVDFVIEKKGGIHQVLTRHLGMK